MNLETFVKVNFRCENNQKTFLRNSKCIVHISLGQIYHEGEKFIATMDLINETFKHCDLILCDTLQRYTVMIENENIDEKEAYRITKEKGTEWLERNKLALNHLTIPIKIFRWDYWLKHKNFQKYKNIIMELYENNYAYRKSLDLTIDKFLARKINIIYGSSEFKRATDLSLQYLLEECPVLIPLWAETKDEFVIYPRFRTPAMKATYNYFIPDASILKEVALKFNKRVKPKKLSLDIPVIFESLSTF